MSGLLSRIKEATTEEELRDLNDEILKVGMITGMHGFAPLQDAFKKRLHEIKKGEGDGD